MWHVSYRKFAALLAVVLAVTIPRNSHAGEPEPHSNSDIFGQWRVISVLDAAEITGMSERQAFSLVGGMLDISAKEFRFQNQTCHAPGYERREQEPARYLREAWHARSGMLNLPDPVTVINAGCTDIFIKSKGKLVFNWDGFFFEAIKEPRTKTHRPVT